MASWQDSLLPRNATKLDAAQEGADAARFPLDTNAPVRVKDPFAVDQRLLPLVAWERSVDVWRSDWTLAKRRYVTSIAYELTRLKGTRAGVKKFIEIAGADPLRIDAPPLMAFPGKAITAAERAAWLARFPQLRTYKYSRRGADLNAIFPSSAGDPLVFPLVSPQVAPEQDVNLFLGYQTYLWENGALIPLTAWEIVKVQWNGTIERFRQVLLPGPGGDTSFLGDDISNGWFPAIIDALSERFVSIKIDDADYGNANPDFTARTVSPGLTPISIKPEHASDGGTAVAAEWYLADDPADPVWCMLNDAPLHVYDRIYLYRQDLAGVIPAPDSGMFLDDGYFQFPPYWARIRILLTGTMPPDVVDEYIYGFLTDPDFPDLWVVMDAVKASVSARDKIQVDTQSFDLVRSSQSLMCGTHTCGAQIRI